MNEINSCYNEVSALILKYSHKMKVSPVLYESQNFSKHKTFVHFPFQCPTAAEIKKKNRMTESSNKLSHLKKKKKQVKISMKEISKINNQCNLNTCSIRDIIVELQFNYSQSGWHHT